MVVLRGSVGVGAGGGVGWGACAGWGEAGGAEADDVGAAELGGMGLVGEATGAGGAEAVAWGVIDAGVEAESFRGEQLAYAEGVLGLVPWEERADVPAWAREIALCLTLHGMHWTGAIFNTYDQMLDAIRFVTDRIDGRHVLAYLPGWEGRYYWQYGDYRPEPRLGGADGFARLCAGARERLSLIHISEPTRPS